jgi:hypothetical protein
MLRLLVASSCVFAAAGAIAEPLRLTGPTLKTTLAGALLEFDTPLGTTIPVRFFKNGLVSGKAGIMGPVLGAERDRGRWWVADDRLCVKWFRWFEAEKRCVVVVQEGARLHWSGASGRSGTAVIVDRPQEAEVAAAEPKPSREGAAKPPPAEPKLDMAAATEPPSIEAKPTLDDTGRMTFAAAGAVGTAPFNLIPAAVAAPAPDASAPPAASPQPAPTAPPATATAAAPAVKAAIATVAPASPPRRPSAKQAPTAASSLVMRTSFRVAGVDEDDMLNVRSGPSEFAETIGVIPPEGRGVKIVGECRDGWCPIVHGRTRGWVNGYYLVAEGTSAAGQ